MRKFRLLSCIAFSALLLISWKPNRYSKIVPEKNEIKIAMNKVNDGRPHYYKVDLLENQILFFVLMDDEGIVRAAFDACDICFPEKRGYRQDGDFMICNNCGQSFHETKINVIKGGCNPAPLERIFDRQYVYISVDALQQGATYF
jgi:uncharacterized membrane protein